MANPPVTASQKEEKKSTLFSAVLQIAPLTPASDLREIPAVRGVMAYAAHTPTAARPETGEEFRARLESPAAGGRGLGCLPPSALPVLHLLPHSNRGSQARPLPCIQAFASLNFSGALTPTSTDSGSLSHLSGRLHALHLNPSLLCITPQDPIRPLHRPQDPIPPLKCPSRHYPSLEVPPTRPQSTRIQGGLASLSALP